MLQFLICYFFTLLFVLMSCSSSSSSSPTAGIVVQQLSGYACSLSFNSRVYNCSLGKNGVSSSKVEGDGCSPAGTYPLRQGYYRKDRIGEGPFAPPFLLMNQTTPIDGWCDDPLDVVNYNKYVTLPFQGSHEDLWLTDSAAYDLMLVIGYNDDPVIVGKGSAIFFHVTETFGPTAGCVALSLGDMQEVLSQLTPDNAFITILPAAAVE